MIRLGNLMFREIKAFIDLLAKQESGQSYWLMACEASESMHPDIFQRLVNTGANVAEVDDLGWNCLFQCVAFACFPDSATEFEALRSLLALFDDILATDIRGIDISSYVNEEENWMTHLYQDCGSYRQDLWYCALKRSGLDVRYDIAPCSRIARYTTCYTPKHYLAFCHLDSWNKRNLGSKMDQLLLEYPMTEEETQLTRRREEEPLRAWLSSYISRFENEDGSESAPESQGPRPFKGDSM